MKTKFLSISRLAVASLGLSLFSLAASAQSETALTAYYGVKDALVATDAAAAKTSAVALSSALSKVKATPLSAADKKALAAAKANAVAISKTTDVDVQRDQFESLSTNMIALAKATKPAKTYVQFCPMAADGKGAFWLSGQKEIKNPYYGSKMLKCGSVKEEI
jgi:hypothetical protein